MSNIYNNNGDRAKHYSQDASLYYPNKYYEYNANTFFYCLTGGRAMIKILRMYSFLFN